MNINFMRYFVTVAETGSFTAASKALDIAQPAISMALTKLESELGAELINRSKRKFELTYSGEVFLKHCMHILNSTDNAMNEIKEINNLEQGSIKIAAPTLIAATKIAEIVSEFHHLRPNLAVQLKTGDSVMLNKMIQGNEQDLVIINERDVKNNLDSTPIYQDEIQVLMHKNHPLANSQHIPFDVLMNQPMCASLDTVILDRFFEQVYNTKNLRPNIVLETNLQNLIISSIRHNNLICIAGADMYCDAEDIISIPLEGRKYPFTLCAAWQKNRYVSKATEEFLEFLKKSLMQQDKKTASHRA